MHRSAEKCAERSGALMMGPRLNTGLMLQSSAYAVERPVQPLGTWIELLDRLGSLK